MEFRHISSEVIHSEWDFIKQGIISILDKTQDRWLPEDIYWLIKQNSIWAYVVLDGEEKLGVVLLQPTNGWDGKELYLFGGWNIGSRDVIEFSMPEIVKVAKHCQARRIKFQSPRKGFDKYVERIGFKYSHSMFEREL
jgi:hypothetical protein